MATVVLLGGAVRDGAQAADGTEGNFISGSPGAPVGMALYYLSEWGDNALGGNASSRYKGNHITTGIVLKKGQ